MNLCRIHLIFEIENNLEESLDQLNNVNELGNGVNLDKISASAQGALNGDFIDSSKLKKSIIINECYIL